MEYYVTIGRNHTKCPSVTSMPKRIIPGAHGGGGGGVSPGREITATGIFLYLYYPGIRIRMLIRSTWFFFVVFAIFVHVVW